MCTYELIGMHIIMSFALYILSVDVIWMDSATYVRTGGITVNTGEYCTGLKKKEKCRLFYFTSRLCICSRVSHWNWISTQSIRKCWKCYKHFAIVVLFWSSLTATTMTCMHLLKVSLSLVQVTVVYSIDLYFFTTIDWWMSPSRADHAGLIRRQSHAASR